jgi:putative ABC transport system ATP-binding protein
VMGEEIMDLLLGLNRQEGTTIVMVTHDEQQARKTQRLVRLFDGSQVG